MEFQRETAFSTCFGSLQDNLPPQQDKERFSHLAMQYNRPSKQCNPLFPRFTEGDSYLAFHISLQWASALLQDDPEKQEIDRGNWWTDFQELQRLLRHAAAKCYRQNTIRKVDKEKYFMSGKSLSGVSGALLRSEQSCGFFLSVSLSCVWLIQKRHRVCLFLQLLKTKYAMVSWTTISNTEPLWSTETLWTWWITCTTL